MSALAAAAQAEPGGLDPVTVTTLTAAAAAAVGAVVAYQAYRGYRRNASRAMLYLTIAVLLLTTVPFAVRWALVLPDLAGTTMGELAAQVCRIAGLLVVLYVLAGGTASSRSGAGGTDAGGPDEGRTTHDEGADEVRDEGRTTHDEVRDADRDERPAEGPTEGPDGEGGEGPGAERG